MNQDQIKRDYLLDIIRRVIANPDNAREVADKLAEDWFPPMFSLIDSKGRRDILKSENKK